MIEHSCGVTFDVFIELNAAHHKRQHRRQLALAVFNRGST
jgi:hypothetical protein